MAIQIALYHPEIPPNTGSIARLCAATRITLNLIEPLGFSLADRYLKRAGLDYWPHVSLRVWPDWEAFASVLAAEAPSARVIPASARRGAPHHRFAFQPDDVLLLGPETTGLPEDFAEQFPHAVRIPIWGQVRSLNLACATAVLAYEALRQVGELEGK